jgi:hypothetical protein
MSQVRVIGGAVVPCRAQHVGTHNRPVVEQLGKVSGVRGRRSRCHGPRRLGRVLRLDRKQRTDYVDGGRQVRFDEVLYAQAPACEGEIADHSSTTD